MTEEEMQKKMEFILEQQAQFAVNIDVLRENVSLLAESQRRTDATVANMARMQTHMNEVVAAVAEAQQRTEEKVAELLESQARTDDRLNTLINVVERHISEGHNGRVQG
jgi:predicted fused transcriptional regulator/phosphomethylpyrimidine kinase